MLPGGSPTCTTTLTGAQTNVSVATGVTCLNSATVSGNVTVAAGASLVAKATTIGGTLTATGADAVQLFGSTVTGAAAVRNSTRDVTIAGSTFRGGLALTGNTQVSANDRYSRLAGAYGPILAGSTVYGLTCSANSAEVSDFGAQEHVQGQPERCRRVPRPGLDRRRRRRLRAGHARPDAGRPGDVRRVHAGRDEDLHRLDHGHRDLDRG